MFGFRYRPILETIVTRLRHNPCAGVEIFHTLDYTIYGIHVTEAALVLLVVIVLFQWLMRSG